MSTPLERPTFTTQSTVTYSLDEGEYIVRWYRGEDCTRQYVTIQYAGAITMTIKDGERVEVQKIEGGGRMNTRPPMTYEDREPLRNGTLLGLPTREVIAQETDRNLLRAYALALLTEVEHLVHSIDELSWA